MDHKSEAKFGLRLRLKLRFLNTEMSGADGAAKKEPGSDDEEPRKANPNNIPSTTTTTRSYQEPVNTLMS